DLVAEWDPDAEATEAGEDLLNSSLGPVVPKTLAVDGSSTQPVVPDTKPTALKSVAKAKPTTK
ncbi:hypothetical protein HaLaN_31969, partial [Haematococcus lacustris]